MGPLHHCRVSSSQANAARKKKMADGWTEDLLNQFWSPSSLLPFEQSSISSHTKDPTPENVHRKTICSSIFFFSTKPSVFNPLPFSRILIGFCQSWRVKSLTLKLYSHFTVYIYSLTFLFSCQDKKCNLGPNDIFKPFISGSGYEVGQTHGKAFFFFLFVVYNFFFTCFRYKYLLVVNRC